MLACPAIQCASKFLADCGELILRVVGHEHDGRLVRIRSPKCTIGSARGCTLRVRGAGLAPVHCWVLRGKQGAVVRRLHGRVQVNGAAAEESALAPGDRLRVGAVELEVIASHGPEQKAAELFAVPPADTAELERELAAALEKIKLLEGESRQGWQSSITAADRADQLRTALAGAHQQLDEACRELAATQTTMQRQNAELQALRNELTAAEQASDEHAELQSRMQLESAALRDEQTRILAELNDLRAELNEARTALAGALEERSRLAASAAELEARLEAERERWQTEREQSQAELAQSQRRLAQRDAELAAMREQSMTQTGAMTCPLPSSPGATERWERHAPPGATVQMEELRRQTEAVPSPAQTQCADLERQLAELKSAADAREQAWNRERDELARGAAEQHAALERELGELGGQLIQREQELALAAGRLQEAESAIARCEALERELAERSHSAQQIELLEARCRELEEQRNNALAQAAASYRDAPAATEDTPARSDDDDPPPSATLPLSAQPEQEPAAATEPPPVPPPGEAAMAAAPFEAAQSEPAQSEPAQSEPAAAEPAAAEPVADAAPAAAEVSVTMPPANDSLHRYMSQLLQRVRGESPAAPAAPAPPPSAADVPTPPLAEPAAALSAPAALLAQTAPEPEADYLPRTTAPEQKLGLSAMREVANTVTRETINAHTRKHTGRDALGRVFAATQIIAISSVLGYWAWSSQSPYAGIAAAIGAFAALAGLLTALRRLLTVLRLNRPATA